MWGDSRKIPPGARSDLPGHTMLSLSLSFIMEITPRLAGWPPSQKIIIFLVLHKIYFPLLCKVTYLLENKRLKHADKEGSGVGAVYFVV